MGDILTRNLNLDYYINLRIYKVFNIQQLNKNGINMQDAKNVFYMYEKKSIFICQINKIKSINFLEYFEFRAKL